MDKSKWGFIPTEQIIWFEQDMQDRNYSADTDDMYER
jgi:hypothetical protein